MPYLSVLDPCGATGALLSSLLEHHPVHQLAVVDRTTKLLADLSTPKERREEGVSGTEKLKSRALSQRGTKMSQTTSLASRYLH